MNLQHINIMKKCNNKKKGVAPLFNCTEGGNMKSFIFGKEIFPAWFVNIEKASEMIFEKDEKNSFFSSFISI